MPRPEGPKAILSSRECHNSGEELCGFLLGRYFSSLAPTVLVVIALLAVLSLPPTRSGSTKPALLPPRQQQMGPVTDHASALPATDTSPRSLVSGLSSTAPNQSAFISLLVNTFTEDHVIPRRKLLTQTCYLSEWHCHLLIYV